MKITGETSRASPVAREQAMLPSLVFWSFTLNRGVGRLPDDFGHLLRL